MNQRLYFFIALLNTYIIFPAFNQNPYLKYINLEHIKASRSYQKPTITMLPKQKPSPSSPSITPLSQPSSASAKKD